MKIFIKKPDCIEGEIVEISGVVEIQKIFNDKFSGYSFDSKTSILFSENEQMKKENFNFQLEINNQKIDIYGTAVFVYDDEQKFGSLDENSINKIIKYFKS